MKIIAFMARGYPVNEGDAVREILSHLGEPVDPPRMAPARAPPLWEAAGQGSEDFLVQPPPEYESEYEFDQRIAW